MFVGRKIYLWHQYHILNERKETNDNRRTKNHNSNGQSI